jgi:uncharacterized membrane protein YkvA (DUF1232 family)
MLNALKDRIEALHQDPNDPFTAEIRRIVGLSEATHTEPHLRQMILHLPDMIRQIHRWAQAPDVSPEVRKLHAFALAYLFNPTDFLPEKHLGFFGYLDDAYLVGSVYQTTMYSDAWMELKPMVDDVSLTIRVPDWLALTRRVIPRVTERIDKFLDTVDRNASPLARG